MRITRNDIETTKGPSDWFTGDVFTSTPAPAPPGTRTCIRRCHAHPQPPELSCAPRRCLQED